MDLADERTPSASTAPTVPVVDQPTATDVDWIGRRDIASIPGALKASAYVARAYHHFKAIGAAPAWARKMPGGQWLFDRQYIAADAGENQATIGITEAAAVVGATRRALQTWVDEGLIPATTGGRAKGESRRIPRDAFLRVVPELRQRLRHATPPAKPHHPPAPVAAGARPASEKALRVELQRQAAAEEQRIAADVSRELSEAEALRRRIERKRAVAERRLRNLAREEQRAKEREARLQDTFAVRLRHARRDAHAADRRRTAAEERARQTAAKEQEALAQERQLRETLSQRLAEWRRRSAARIAAQLQEARALFARAPAVAPSPTPAPHTDQERRRSAAAVAAQLHEARAQVRELSGLEADVEQMAARLAEEVAAGQRDRYDAAILFNDILEKRAVPDELRIAVMKRYFSRG